MHFLALLILPITARFSYASEQSPVILSEDSAAKTSSQSEDFSLDGITAKASDGGRPCSATSASWACPRPATRGL